MFGDLEAPLPPPTVVISVISEPDIEEAAPLVALNVPPVPAAPTSIV